VRIPMSSGLVSEELLDPTALALEDTGSGDANHGAHSWSLLPRRFISFATGSLGPSAYYAS